jgi:glycosyltransferase involved in cell wall biosynthesis
MRVCHVCIGHRTDDPRVFAKECVSLAAAGYEVHLIARSSQTREYCDQGVIVHPWPTFSSRARRVAAGIRVARQARAIQADLYHVHEPELLAPTLAAVGDRPVIWDAHEPYQDKIFERPWIPQSLKPAVSAGWKMAERVLVRRCAAVVTVSTLMAGSFEHLHRRVCILHNYPRLNILKSGTDLLRPRRRNRCVFAGTLAESNYILGMIQAIGILKKRGVEIGLDLAGEPESQAFSDRMIETTRTLDVQDRVKFHGLLPRTDAIRLQAESGIGLVVTKPNAGNRVGYPIKLFELMALGLPIVYSDLPTFREVVGSSQCGLAVDAENLEQVADAIARIAGDEQFADQLGDAGRTAVRQIFNWEHEEPALLNLYRELIGQPQSRARDDAGQGRIQ